MLPYLCSYYGNPHSRTHAYGWESEAAVEKARKVDHYGHNYGHHVLLIKGACLLEGFFFILASS